MKLFLDTSVLLAASGSSVGASRHIFIRASSNHWTLIATPYVIEEVERNLSSLPPIAADDWAMLRPKLRLTEDILTLDRPAIFPTAKDKPILFSALAWAHGLLTLDRQDFGGLLDKTFYGLWVLKPGTFLEKERASGRLLPPLENAPPIVP